jgi:hypothetical protein
MGAFSELAASFAEDFSTWRKTDPETSRNRLSADRITRIQQDILTYVLRYPGGVTDLDIQNHFNDQGSTYRTRRAELVKGGLLKDSGARMRQNGRLRVLWVAA